MIGQRLRELRKANGLTQEQLAGYLKSAKSTISQYENNINEPDLETLVRLADRFGVTVDYLIGRTDYGDRKAANSEAMVLRESLTEDEQAYLLESLEMYRRWRNRHEKLSGGEAPHDGSHPDDGSRADGADS